MKMITSNKISSTVNDALFRRLPCAFKNVVFILSPKSCSLFYRMELQIHARKKFSQGELFKGRLSWQVWAWLGLVYLMTTTWDREVGVAVEGVLCRLNSSSGSRDITWAYPTSTAHSWVAPHRGDSAFLNLTLLTQPSRSSDWVIRFK